MMQTATVNKPLKVYVAVKADFAADGTMFPWIITWEEGEKYEIDRMSNIRRFISYSGRQSHLVFERSANLTGNNIGRWFVERR